MYYLQYPYFQVAQKKKSYFASSKFMIFPFPDTSVLEVCYVFRMYFHDYLWIQVRLKPQLNYLCEVISDYCFAHTHTHIHLQFLLEKEDIVLVIYTKEYILFYGLIVMSMVTIQCAVILVFLMIHSCLQVFYPVQFTLLKRGYLFKFSTLDSIFTS